MAVGIAAALLLSTAGEAAAAAPARDSLDLHVTDDAGRPVKSGRVLVSVMWPTEALWKANKASVSRIVSTDASGHVKVKLGISKAEREAIKANGGTANVVVSPIAPDGTPARAVGLSRYMGSDTALIAREDKATAPGRSISLKLDRSTVDATKRDIGRRALNRPAADGTDAEVTPLATYTGCINYRWEAEEYTWGYTRIGSLNSAGDTTRVSHTYGTSSDAYLDIGFKAGTDAWSISGSLHSTESIGSEDVEYGASNYHWGILAPFDFVHLYLYATCIGQSHAYMSQQMVEQDGYHRSASLTHSYTVTQPARDKAHPEWSKYFFENKGYARTTTKFKKYGGAVTVWGASLGAQSGASVYSKQSWTFGSGQHYHWLYGSGAHPDTAPIIYASNS